MMVSVRVYLSISIVANTPHAFRKASLVLLKLDKTAREVKICEALIQIPAETSGSGSF
jgi:hypothetical protein